MFTLTKQMSENYKESRQAGVQVEITREMANAGARELDRLIGADARHVYSSEEIAEFIFRAMARPSQSES